MRLQQPDTNVSNTKKKNCSCTKSSTTTKRTSLSMSAAKACAGSHQNNFYIDDGPKKCRYITGLSHKSSASSEFRDQAYRSTPCRSLPHVTRRPPLGREMNKRQTSNILSSQDQMDKDRTSKYPYLPKNKQVSNIKNPTLTNSTSTEKKPPAKKEHPKQNRTFKACHTRRQASYQPPPPPHLSLPRLP